MTQAVLGVDIGGTNIETGIVKPDGEIINIHKIKTSTFQTPEQFAQYLIGIISQYKNKLQILGIGIGAPTANMLTGQIEYAPNLTWKGIVPLEKIVQQATGIKTKLTNDANAVAHGELAFGTPKNIKHFIILTLGTGLGSGIVVDGKVLYGQHGLAGEFGHTLYEPNGRLCSCGRKGCLEAYVSIRGIKITYQNLGGNSSLSPAQIYDLAKKNDIIALSTYKQTAEILGSKITDLVHIFDPEVIYLYGGIAHAHDIIIPYAYKQMERELLPAFKGRIKIKPSNLLNKNGAVLGAAALILEDI